MSEQYAFGAGRLFARNTANGTPVEFGELQGVTLTFSHATREVYGRQQFPIAAFRGGGKITGKADFARFNGRLFGELFFDSAPEVGAKRVVQREAQTVAGNTVTATHGANFVADLGVVRADSGLRFERATVPSGGQQYACNESTGVYLFDMDTANYLCAHAPASNVLIAYAWQDTANGIEVSIVNQEQGNAPVFTAVFTETTNGESMTIVLNACQAGKFGMQFGLDSFTIPSFDFSAFADADNIVGTISLDDDETGPFIEDFESGLGQYATISGSRAPFSLVETDYGDSLRATSTSSANDNSQIRRDIGARVLTALVAKFRLRSLGIDDAMALELFGSGVERLSFNPRREAAYDGLSRAMFYINGSPVPISSVALLQDVWYELVLRNEEAIIRTIPDNTVVYTISTGPLSLAIDTMIFRVDKADSNLSETEYDDILIC